MAQKVRLYPKAEVRNAGADIDLCRHAGQNIQLFADCRGYLGIHWQYVNAVIYFFTVSRVFLERICAEVNDRAGHAIADNMSNPPDQDADIGWTERQGDKPDSDG